MTTEKKKGQDSTDVACADCAETRPHTHVHPTSPFGQEVAANRRALGLPPQTFVLTPTLEQFIEAANSLLEALEGSQCWGGTHIGEKMQALDRLIRASACNPPHACKTHGRCWTHSTEKA